MMENQTFGKLTSFINLLLVIALTLNILVLGSCKTDSPIFKATFDRIVYDFGEVPADEKVSVAFEITNEGNQPLRIKDIKSNCGCTVPEAFDGALAPSETREILVDIDPYVLGAFNSSITVFFQENVPPQTLKITGKFEYISLLN